MRRRRKPAVPLAEPILTVDQINWDQVDWDDGPRCPCGEKATVERAPEGVSPYSAILVPTMPFCDIHRSVPLTTPWTRYANGRSWPCIWGSDGRWHEDPNAPWLVD